MENRFGIKSEEADGCTTDYDADDERQTDRQLMPPPSFTSSLSSQNNESKEENSKKKNTPLAAMLPSKYQGIDVSEIFPDFRMDKVYISWLYLPI